MRTFTLTEDALIREQPVTGISLKTLEKMVGISRETLLRRAHELGVSLIKDDHDQTIDTRLRGGDKLARAAEASTHRPNTCAIRFRLKPRQAAAQSYPTMSRCKGRTGLKSLAREFIIGAALLAGVLVQVYYSDQSPQPLECTRSSLVVMVLNCTWLFF